MANKDKKPEWMVYNGEDADLADLNSDVGAFLIYL